MPEIVECEYPYRLNPFYLWAAPLFSGPIGGLSIYFALTNSTTISLLGLLAIPVALVNLGAWIIGAFFICFFTAAVLFILQALLYKRRIGFTATAMLVPIGFWLPKDRIISYSHIFELIPSTESDNSQAIIVRYTHGEFPISESLLPSRDDFHELASELLTRVTRDKSPQRNAQNQKPTPSIWVTKPRQMGPDYR